MIDYYALPEVSSSDLGALKRMFYNDERDLSELEDVFNFGSLVDAMLTERGRVFWAAHQLIDGYKLIDFTPDVWHQAERLAEALRKDKVVALMLKVMIGQYVFRRTLTFTYEGDDYEIRARCKLDGYCKRFATGLDYKTTACKTRKEFIGAIDFFDWDKQAAFYMDLAKLERFWIIGISKKTGEIFKHAIERGDETYLRGRGKYTVWSYRWKMLIEPFANHLKLAA